MCSRVVSFLLAFFRPGVVLNLCLAFPLIDENYITPVRTKKICSRSSLHPIGVQTIPQALCNFISFCPNRWALRCRQTPCGSAACIDLSTCIKHNRSRGSFQSCPRGTRKSSWRTSARRAEILFAASSIRCLHQRIRGTACLLTCCGSMQSSSYSVKLVTFCTRSLP